MTVAAYLIIIRDDQVLLLRRFNTGYADGQYSLIAGHLDGGETVQQAICREALEEGGITLHEQDVRIVHVMHRRGDEGKERVDYFCTAEKWEGEPLIGEPEKCDDVSWFALNKLPQNILPYVNDALKYFQTDTPFSSHGF